jgi:hypothetical protein
MKKTVIILSAIIMMTNTICSQERFVLLCGNAKPISYQRIDIVDESVTEMVENLKSISLSRRGEYYELELFYKNSDTAEYWTFRATPAENDTILTAECMQWRWLSCLEHVENGIVLTIDSITVENSGTAYFDDKANGIININSDETVTLTVKINLYQDLIYRFIWEKPTARN